MKITRVLRVCVLLSVLPVSASEMIVNSVDCGVVRVWRDLTAYQGYRTDFARDAGDKVWFNQSGPNEIAFFIRSFSKTFNLRILTNEQTQDGYRGEFKYGSDAKFLEPVLCTIRFRSQAVAVEQN